MENQSKIRAIVAMAKNRVIGNGLEIPWHLPEDFKWFKKCTTNQIIVMGKNTWLSLGQKALPNRQNVVISSSLKEANGAIVFSSLEEALKHFEGDGRTIWIIGGAYLYEKALPLCDEIYLSQINLEPKGDVFFPAFEDNFSLEEEIPKEGFCVKIYKKN